MPKFRLMATEGTSQAVMYNLERRLTSIQSVFPFNVHPEPVAVQRLREMPAPSKVLEDLALEIGRRNYHGEVPLLITDCEIDDGFSSFDDTVAVISIYHWRDKGFSPWPVDRYLLYTIADILMNVDVDTPVHYDKRSCIGSYCDDEREINSCLEQCDYCTECRRLISSALTNGEIAPRRLAAIHRILDSAAERYRAFVIMPFHADFDELFDCVKRTLGELAWQCVRADTIPRSEDILKIIYEETNRCNLVIADLTKLHPNVLYEVGYADAVGRNVILITQDIRTVPFDLRQRGLLEYCPTAVGYAKLAENLRSHRQIAMDGSI